MIIGAHYRANILQFAAFCDDVFQAEHVVFTKLFEPSHNSVILAA